MVYVRRSFVAKLFAIGLVSILVCVMSGCASVKNDWNAAEAENTVQSYREFVELRPNLDRSLLEKAHSRIDDIINAEWKRAREEDTVEGYESFLALEPTGDLRKEASSRLEAVKERDDDDYRLAKLVQSMCYSFVIPGLNDISVTGPSALNEYVPAIEKLLEAGADPRAYRIKGFRSARKIESEANGMKRVTCIDGSKGVVVGASEGGMSLLEVVEGYDRACLEKHGVSFDCAKLLRLREGM